MRRFTWLLVCFLAYFLVLTGCRDKEFEEHYGRPDWLPAPVYQQLESKGNFKNFLACVDKAGYKTTLSGAGYFTVFAPNDEAFSTFFTEQGISGADAIDENMARKIVTYALVYNAFQKEKLSDYQSNLGWQPLDAFKRRTAYYDGVYDETTFDGRNLKVTSSNRNGTYVFGDNNNKYIPYFIDSYFAAKNLTASDYNYFYPDVPFSGFNVANANVVTSDIRAENGVIHEVDKVILPLPSIELYLNQNSQYSVFNDLLRKYAITYQTQTEVTNRYQVMTGSNESVYVKYYSSGLAFSPNNENFLKQADNDGQSNGWTLFAPSNQAVSNYISTVLLEHYNSLDDMPPSIINDFINAHMWQTTVWPSKFNSSLNFLGEEARFEAASNITDAKVLSNGMFYGTDKVQEADVFRSVYGRAYLDPKYSLMTRFLNRELKSTIISPHVKFTLFLVPDEVLKAAGHDYNLATNEWVYNGTTNLAVENWTRMINMHVVITQKGELNNLSGQGIVETYGGEFLKYNNNTVFATGNQEDNVIVNVNTSQNPSKIVYNGIVHYADKIIKFPDNDPIKGLAFYIRDQGDQTSKPYYRFYEYLRNSPILNPATSGAGAGDIAGVSAGVFYTFFIPSNTAMQKAVTDGVIPASISATSSEADKQKVINFILYHIMPKFSVIGNGKEEGTFETMYKTIAGDPTVITISNKPDINEFKVTDMKGRVANVVSGTASNVLGNRAVFHQIDNYLSY